MIPARYSSPRRRVPAPSSRAVDPWVSRPLSTALRPAAPPKQPQDRIGSRDRNESPRYPRDAPRC
ncbi:hypothetical protein ACFPRL_33105 [Pseudoclavibacter helvolus]